MFGLTLDTIRNIKNTFSKFKAIKKVILYGSPAKGKDRTGSDIDITLLGDKLKVKTIYDLQDELEELDLPYLFDISIFSQIDNPDLVEHIQRVGKVFYEREWSLPKGWEMKRLGEIGKIFNGNSVNAKFKKENYADLTNGYPYIATKDISYECVIDYDNGIKIPFEEKSKFKIAPKNTILICAEGGSAGRKIGFINQDVCFGNKLFALLVKKNIYSRFVYYFYFSSIFQKQFISKLTGIIGGVSIKKFKDLEIFLPPLSEQKAIVAILDKAFTAIDKAKANTEQNLKNARELFESYLQGVFENKGGDWEMKRLGEVCEVISGQSPASKYYNMSGEGLPFYQGKKNFSKKYIGEPTKWTTKITKEAEADDILMSVRAPVGPINFSTQKICIGRGLATIRCGKLVDKEFLFNFLLKHENEIIGNTGAVFNSINKKQIKAIPIPIPPLSEQKAIVKKLDVLSSKTKKLESIYQKKIDNLEELRKSMLQKAFRGEL